MIAFSVDSASYRHRHQVHRLDRLFLDEIKDNQSDLVSQVNTFGKQIKLPIILKIVCVLEKNYITLKSKVKLNDK